MISGSFRSGAVAGTFRITVLFFALFNVLRLLFMFLLNLTTGLTLTLFYRFIHRADSSSTKGAIYSHGESILCIHKLCLRTPPRARSKLTYSKLFFSIRFIMRLKSYAFLKAKKDETKGGQKKTTKEWRKHVCNIRPYYTVKYVFFELHL